MSHSVEVPILPNGFRDNGLFRIKKEERVVSRSLSDKPSSWSGCMEFPVGLILGPSFHFPKDLKLEECYMLKSCGKYKFKKN